MSEDFFFQLCEQLSNHIWLQALIMLVGTCFLEDAARCGIGLLVAAELGELGAASVLSGRRRVDGVRPAERWRFLPGAAGGAGWPIICWLSTTAAV